MSKKTREELKKVLPEQRVLFACREHQIQACMDCPDLKCGDNRWVPTLIRGFNEDTIKAMITELFECWGLIDALTAVALNGKLDITAAREKILIKLLSYHADE